MTILCLMAVLCPPSASGCAIGASAMTSDRHECHAEPYAYNFWSRSFVRFPAVIHETRYSFRGLVFGCSSKGTIGQGRTTQTLVTMYIFITDVGTCASGISRDDCDSHAVTRSYRNGFEHNRLTRRLRPLDRAQAFFTYPCPLHRFPCRSPLNGRWLFWCIL